jgi:hypothetical protein
LAGCSVWVAEWLVHWSSVALRYDVAFNWSLNPFFHTEGQGQAAAANACCLSRMSLYIDWISSESWIFYGC